MSRAELSAAANHFFNSILPAATQKLADLTNPEVSDTAPGVSDTKDMFFTGPSTDVPRWLVPQKPDGVKEYSYAVTWINTDGSQKVVGPRNVSDEELLLHLLL